MVGVPGRSKACITCRKRRKGCDHKRPTCSQCNKAGLKCEGYAAQRVFVVSTPDSRQAGYSVSRESYHRPGTAAGSSSSSSQSWQPQQQQQQQQQQVSRNQASSTTPTTNLRLLARPEDERRCIDLFWEAYFPAGQPIPTNASRSYICAWTETARRFYRDDDSLRYALWANCLLMTGRRHGAVWMLREGSKAYGKALGNLRRSLQMSYRVRMDVPIATIKLLTMFEAFSQQGLEPKTNEAQAWQRHYAGELALFIARTPVAHIDGDSHDVFADERVDMALSAMLRRERLVLSTPEWKSIPWQAIPKDYKDILVDALVDIPGLVEDFDNMQLCDEKGRQEHLRLELVRKCWAVDRQLQTWLGLLRRLGAKPGEQSCLDPSGKDLVTYVAQVQGMSWYWTASVVLYTILRLASSFPTTITCARAISSASSSAAASVTGTVAAAADQWPAHTDPAEHARNLVTAVAILLQPSARLYGQHHAALPLEIALQYATAMRPVSPDGEALLGTIMALKRRLHTKLTGC